MSVVSHVDAVDTRDQSKTCFNGSNTMLCRYCRYKHVHTFLFITLLIFNGFSIWKRFWTADNQGFATMPNIHACRYSQYKHKISNAFNAMLC